MRRILIYSLFFLGIQYGFSCEMSKTKKIVKEWSVNSGTNVSFVTKYQDVDIIFWNENKVKLDITINSNEDISASDLEEKIEISAENSGNTLLISTRLRPDKSPSIWNTLFGSDKSSDVEIKSQLYLPSNLAGLAIVSKYSDLKSESIPVAFTLKASYGDITISELKKSSDITSSYSDIRIKKADDLDITATHGDVFITQVNALKMNSSYTDLALDKLDKSFVSAATYGNIEIKDIAKDFSSIKCTGVYSDYTFHINEANPIQLDLHSRNGDINPGAYFAAKVQEDEDRNETTLQTKTKTASLSSPVIVVNTIYGDVNIK
ncbi:MAG: hypothetical protein JWN78_1930 [Bacteroidota bacterium]|nr:hypothetical protein [Bacteroidota bacterium]